MIGGMPLGAGPIGSANLIPGAFYVEADGVLSQTAAAAFALARVRGGGVAFAQADASAFNGVRIATTDITDAAQAADLFIDGQVFEPGGFIFTMNQRAVSAFRGGVVRSAAVAMTQSDSTAINGVRIAAAQTAMVQGITTDFRALMIVTAEGTATPAAILNMEASAIRSGGLTAVQRAVVTFLAGKLIENLPDYAMKRQAEDRTMRRL